MFFSATIDHLRNLNRNRVYNRLLRRPCVNHPNGFLYSGRGAALKEGSHEPYQTDLVSKILTEVDLFINIGANHGFYPCLALSQNLPTIAFEPHPINCAMIKKHVAINGYSTSFELHEVAVGSSAGELTLYGGGQGGSLLKGSSNAPKSQRQNVPVKMLNETVNLGGSKTLCLMDIEGYELEALRGATKLLSNPVKPYWIIEVWSKNSKGEPNPQFSQLFSFMQSFGYESWSISEHKKRAVKLPMELAVLVEKGHSKMESDNFLFVPTGDDLVRRLDI